MFLNKMLKFINSIQEKPKHIRVKIFIVIMVIVSVLLFFTWVSLSVSNSKKEVNKNKEMPTITESINANLKDVFNIENKK